MTRDDAESATIQLSAAIRKAGAAKDSPLAIDYAEADHKDPRYSNGADHLLYIVDANDVRAAQHSRDHRGGRALEPLRHRQIEQLADEGFARGADQDRMPQLLELREPAQDLPVLVRGLAKPDAGIDDHLLLRHAGRDCAGGRRTQESLDLIHQVAGIFSAVLVVHHDQAASMPTGELGEGRSARQTPHVVQDRGAHSDSDLRHLLLVCVERHGHA